VWKKTLEEKYVYMFKNAVKKIFRKKVGKRSFVCCEDMMNYEECVQENG
jgi:murein L,D-transpeptidase YafK